MSKFTDKEYVEYMLANYILGYIDTSIFIGANMFEKYFQDTAPAKDVNREKSKKRKKHLDLWWYIELYFNNGQFTNDVLYDQEDDLKAKLDSFRQLRNEFIHKMDDDQILQRKKEIGDFILYVYYSFHKDKHYNSAIINDKTTNNILLQDYKIREITERMIARTEKEKITTDSVSVKDFKGIDKKDFDNLFELRKKLSYLQCNIEKEMSKVGLEATILSPIDTTSAYIWMPFVDMEFTDTVNKFRTQRNNLLIGSTSILATPIDFRIYIDFGGGDYEYRLAFQNFLQSEQFIRYIQQYRNIDLPLEIFDIKWYSFIIKKQKLFDAIDQNRLNKMVTSAIGTIERGRDQEYIVTSSYNKIGFVLPSKDIRKNEIIKLFQIVAHIYYEFLIYKFKNDPDVSILKEAQDALLRKVIR